MGSGGVGSNEWKIGTSASGTLDFLSLASGYNLTFNTSKYIYRYSETANKDSYGPAGLYVPLSPRVQIGDWISSSTTSYTVVDVTDDGVPKGATSALIGFVIAASGSTTVNLTLSNTSTHYRVNIVRAGRTDIQAEGYVSMLTVPITTTGTFGAFFSSSFTALHNNAYVIGYYL